MEVFRNISQTCVIVSLSLPLQCVSALVQPLGVCAEYLNSSLVQVRVSMPVSIHTHLQFLLVLSSALDFIHLSGHVQHYIFYRRIRDIAWEEK